MKTKIIIVLGQTATGKSALSVGIAERFNGEIINADSMQVYKFMEIGTSKIDAETRQNMPHHLLDIIEPDGEYDASKFAKDAGAKIGEITSRKKIPVVVGGTGLYIRCLLGGVFDFAKDTSAVRKKLAKDLLEKGVGEMYLALKEVDPKAAEKIKPSDRQRILRALEIYRSSGRKISDLQDEHGFRDNNYDCLKIGLKIDKDELLSRIKRRTEMMFDSGLVTEVETLLKKGYKSDSKALNSIGYREAVEVLKSAISVEKARETVVKRTKDYAKRQMTWFKKDGEIKWFDPETEKELIFAAVERFLNS